MNTFVNSKSDYDLAEQSVSSLTGQQIESVRIRRNSKNFHLVEGRAWITHDNNDVIVESGETIAIPASRHRVIISSSNPKHSIRYQLS